MSSGDWVVGDLLGLALPAHEQALCAGGPEFLTRAFQATGALAADNQVVAVEEVRPCPGGSTGQKLFLTVRYAKPEASLHNRLFVKFSRDFTNPIRDRLRDQLAAEVRLGLLSQNPNFTIATPTCYYADYHAESGTGILITQQMTFGKEGVEPLYEKCLDYQIDQPLSHYQAIIKSQARLAGSQKSGKLAAAVERYFPLDCSRQAINQPIRYNREQLQRRVERLASFHQRFPKLFAAELVAPEFLAQLQTELGVFLTAQPNIVEHLHRHRDYIALQHWNANIDNAWFWPDTTGELQCGLMDWGNVSQMNIGSAIWGALSAAETSLWRAQLTSLLNLYIEELAAAGGPTLELEVLKSDCFFTVAILGLGWLMDAPALIEKVVPELNADCDRFHPAIAGNETARTQLQMLSNFLYLWQSQGFLSRLQAIAVS
ncbi:hypothetical protein [Halioxenophilus sp. WMMB6]|uniref:hypothetical protein n=1 Tax=Halioxenophilus sp. WMMB6 TaxID=3073815 RepID=UPI00295E49FF|nr:hypothetical protein [Halioxenophilus sp. WMMB6]